LKVEQLEQDHEVKDKKIREMTIRLEARNKTGLDTHIQKMLKMSSHEADDNLMSSNLVGQKMS
jgi:hypothetical protein